MDSKEKSVISILMLPWLAHGHISPFLELAKRLARKNFIHIYFCSTPINLKPLRETLPRSHLSSIELIDIHLPFTAELPPHYHTTKDLPPHLMSNLKTAFDAAKPAFRNILKTLRPNLVIYDFLQPWAPETAREENIEAVLFLNHGAAIGGFLTHFVKNPETEYPFPAFYFPENERRKIIGFMYDTANGLTNKERYLECIERSSNMVLIKTSREIEEKYAEHMSMIVKKKMVPVGPLVQQPAADKEDDAVIMEWLSKREEPDTVVFVSFGSEYFLSREEITEIALGLEMSRVSFIWVVRFHAEEKLSLKEALPEGFEERIGDEGMVVEGWAPQTKILGHSSVGGFVSHCGWSSTLEGVMFGVPIVAMPMHLDQPLNAKLAVEIGVAVEVRRENGRYEREVVARAIREAVVGEKGKEVRMKIKEMSGRLERRGDEEFHLALDKLVQRAGKSQNF